MAILHGESRRYLIEVFRIVVQEHSRGLGVGNGAAPCLPSCITDANPLFAGRKLGSDTIVVGPQIGSDLWFASLLYNT